MFPQLDPRILLNLRECKIGKQLNMNTHTHTHTHIESAGDVKYANCISAGCVSSNLGPEYHSKTSNSEEILEM